MTASRLAPPGVVDVERGPLARGGPLGRGVEPGDEGGLEEGAVVVNIDGEPLALVEVRPRRRPYGGGNEGGGGGSVDGVVGMEGVDGDGGVSTGAADGRSLAGTPYINRMPA